MDSEQSKTDHKFKLFCWILKESDSPFSVNIGKSDTVDDLKDAIKKKNEPALNHLRASSLILWKLSSPIQSSELDVKLGHAESPQDIAGCIALDPLKDLSEYFSSPPRGHIHIVVQLPESPPDPLRNLGDRRRAWNDNLQKGPPSVLGVPSEFKKHQRSPKAFHFSRPLSAAATVPVTLHHVIFGEFVDNCKTHEPSKEDNDLALALSSAMSDFYDNEKERGTNFRTVLGEYGIELHQTTLEGTEYHTDGDMQCKRMRFVILEVKKEIGSKGAEPLFQAIWYYQRSMEEIAIKYPSALLPCFLIVLFGAHIGFAGATFTDRPNVQVLSPILPFYCHHTDLEGRARVARTLGALRIAIRSLQSYYENFAKINPLAPPALDYPHPLSYTSLSDSKPHSFTYRGQVPGKLVFFGQADDGEDICIKFVHSYSKEAHTLCHSMGCSPALRGFESIAGGWQMVVMDLISSDYRYADTSTPVLCQQEIEEKLAALHQRGYVHGDVRGANLMVRKDGSLGFMLIDFDWAGEIGKAKYPMNVNVNLKEDGSVMRPAGAYDGELIKAEHDIEMLRTIFKVTGTVRRRAPRLQTIREGTI